MARKVTPIPKGYRTVNSLLIVQGADAALSYYEAVFGAEILSRDYAQDGITILQAEMKIGNSIVRLADEMPAFGILSPTSLGGSPVIAQLYIADVDTFWSTVVESGARIAVPLSDTYWGERFGRFVDAFGHVWNVSKRTEILTPGEVAQRATDTFSVVEPDADMVTAVVVEDETLATEFVDLEVNVVEPVTEDVTPLTVIEGDVVDVITGDDSEVIASVA